MNILNIRIDNLSKLEVLNKIREFLAEPDFAKAMSGKHHKIFTPNPEMLVDARKDKYFREVLNSGDLNVCDGFGISLVSLFRHPRAVEDPTRDKDSRFRGNDAFIKRYPGIDLMLDICGLAEKENKSMYLLGSGDREVLKKTKEKLKNKFPNLKIVGVHPGHKIEVIDSQLKIDESENNELMAEIVMTNPDILFVAFGHNKQEKWIYENLPGLPGVKIAMGVGGGFDFISGKVKRAPLFIRKIGLEWLYRLIKQPWRIKRIWKATFIFLFYYYARQKR